jgi:predicted ATP-grasp superfamily ATP-dependent carboligase
MHSFPVVVKPAWWAERGATDFKVLVFHSRERYVEEASGLVRSGATLVVDQFVPGPPDRTYCCLFYRSADGGASRVCTIVETHITPPEAGLIALARVEDMPAARTETERFLAEVDYRGVGGITFKEHDGKLFYIEVNPRLEYVAGAAARAGIDLVRLAYSDLVLGESVSGPTRPRPVYWLDEEKSLRLAVRHRVPGLWRDLLRYLFSPRTERCLWRWSDPRPALAYLSREIRAVFRRWGR